MFTCSMCVKCAKYEVCYFQCTAISCNDLEECENCSIDCVDFELDPTWYLVDDDVPF